MRSAGSIADKVDDTEVDSTNRKEVCIMNFQLKPDRKETENKTIRFPVKLIKDIEAAIRNRDVTFSGFVLQACQYALDNMAEKAPRR